MVLCSVRLSVAMGEFNLSSEIVVGPGFGGKNLCFLINLFPPPLRFLAVFCTLHVGYARSRRFASNPLNTQRLAKEFDLAGRRQCDDGTTTSKEKSGFGDEASRQRVSKSRVTSDSNRKTSWRYRTRNKPVKHIF